MVTVDRQLAFTGLAVVATWIGIAVSIGVRRAATTSAEAANRSASPLVARLPHEYGGTITQ
jgi:hypothetical protein